MKLNPLPKPISVHFTFAGETYFKGEEQLLRKNFDYFDMEEVLRDGSLCKFLGLQFDSNLQSRIKNRETTLDDILCVYNQIYELSIGSVSDIINILKRHDKLLKFPIWLKKLIEHGISFTREQADEIIEDSPKEIKEDVQRVLATLFEPQEYYTWRGKRNSNDYEERKIALSCLIKLVDSKTPYPLAVNDFCNIFLPSISDMNDDKLKRYIIKRLLNLIDRHGKVKDETSKYLSDYISVLRYSSILNSIHPEEIGGRVLYSKPDKLSAIYKEMARGDMLTKEVGNNVPLLLRRYIVMLLSLSVNNMKIRKNDIKTLVEPFLGVIPKSRIEELKEVLHNNYLDPQKTASWICDALNDILMFGNFLKLDYAKQ